VLINVTNC